MQEKKCLWCDPAFEWAEGAFRFCDSCIYKMGPLLGAEHREPTDPVSSLEKVLLSAEGSKNG